METQSGSVYASVETSTLPVATNSAAETSDHVGASTPKTPINRKTGAKYWTGETMHWIGIEWKSGHISVQEYKHPEQVAMAIKNFEALRSFGPFHCTSYEEAVKYAHKKMRPEVSDGRSKRS